MGGATIECALRWGVILVGDYHYWALLTPLWDPRKCKRVVHQTLVKYYYKLVFCKKILQKWSPHMRQMSVILEHLIFTCISQVDGLSIGPPG